jgi:hypothetical protein
VRRARGARALGALLAVAAAVALLFGGSGARSRGPNVDAVSRGPNVATTHVVTALDYALVAQSVPCVMFDYPDGAHMAYVCNEVNNVSGPTWSSAYHRLWNVPYASGGHSDFIWFCNLGGPICVSQAGDGATREEFTYYSQGDQTTWWMKVVAHYGDDFFTRCVFFNSAAQTAVTTC